MSDEQRSRPPEAAGAPQAPASRPDAGAPPGPPPRPPKGTWAGFFWRVFNVLGRPTAFWQSIRQDELTVGQVMWPHVVVLVLLRTTAGLFGNLLQHVPVGAAFGQFATGVVAWMLLVWLFAVVAGSIASVRTARMALQDALRFAAFGLTPLFLVGILAVIPFPYVSPIAELLLMPYTFLVLAQGVAPALGVPADRAPAVVGMVCGALLVLWTVMPTLADLVLAAVLH